MNGHEDCHGGTPAGSALLSRTSRRSSLHVLREVDWLRAMPFLLLHLGCLGVIWVGTSTVAVAVAIGLYLLRMFAITGFYHRYFSHRSFRASRPVQFLMAVLGASAVQRGPLWWAAHHRIHHRHSDQEEDSHSPVQGGFAWSHVLWFMTRIHYDTRLEQVPDLARYPELRFLDRNDVLVPALLAAALFGWGELLQGAGVATSGAQLLVWGFCISTIAVSHATFTINSMAHRFGRQRFPTRDDSRNNLWLALLTLGEGWHNNHHYYPGSARQGFYWYELDLTYYGLQLLARLGLIRDLRPVPRRVLEEGARRA